MDTSLGLGIRAPVASRGTGAMMLVPGRAILDAPGAPPRQSNAGVGSIRIRGANLGSDWEEQLQEWWLQHRRYPEEAARQGEDGTVALHMRLDRYGRVQSVELVSSSGSRWLDLGAEATFRHQKLPPFPPGVREGVADIDIDIEYILIR
jgi:protein TonB